MKIIVTGGAGFIGSHLVDVLIANGANVVVVDNLSSGKTENINSQATFYKENIESPFTQQLIKDVKPDALFHLAAQADVSQSIANPLMDAQTNINGTINLLRGCVEASTPKFIFSSTSAVYGNLDKEVITEDESVNPSSFYGLSKLAAEFYIQLFSNLFPLRYTILRYANVYGPRQLPKGDGGVVSVFLERLKNGEAIHIHGDGEQTRDFVFVKDVVAANLAALEHTNNETLHISTGKSVSINNLLDFLAEIHNKPIHRNFKDARIGDIRHSCLSNALAKSSLSWEPTISLSEGLKYAYEKYM